MLIKRRGNAVASLCWDCKNAVPQGGHGCSWSERFKPVPGWDAERRDISTGPKKRGHDRELFCVSLPGESPPATDEQIAKFIAVCREYKDKYGQMPARLARQWIKEHKRMRDPDSIRYYVYLRATGELVADGGAYHCAKAMGLTPSGWYSALFKVRSGRNDKRVIMTDDGRDDRTEE